MEYFSLVWFVLGAALGAVLTAALGRLRRPKEHDKRGNRR